MRLGKKVFLFFSASIFICYPLNLLFPAICFCNTANQSKDLICLKGATEQTLLFWPVSAINSDLAPMSELSHPGPRTTLTSLKLVQVVCTLIQLTCPINNCFLSSFLGGSGCVVLGDEFSHCWGLTAATWREKGGAGWPLKGQDASSKMNLPPKTALSDNNSDVNCSCVCKHPALIP